MQLTPTESDRLLLFTAAELARRRRDRGLKLNVPEAIALICDEIHEAVRSGVSYQEAEDLGSRLLGSGDVLPGVASAIGTIRLECIFSDGSRILTIRNPIQTRESQANESEDVDVGGIYLADDNISLNDGRRTDEIAVQNRSGYSIFVSSHFHFFEVNRHLVFDRSRAWGKHLDIPAGDVIRWLPNERKTVKVVEYAGQHALYGFNGLTDGPANTERLSEGLEQARAKAFIGSPADKD